MFETHVTFGTHSSRAETRFTLGWLDDQVLATMSLESRWKLLNALSANVSWRDDSVYKKEFEIAWNVASTKAFGITWREFNSSSANFSWKEFSRRQQRIAWEIFTIPHILVPVQDGVWRSEPVVLCTPFDVRMFLSQTGEDFSSFSDFDIGYAISGIVNDFYGELISTGNVSVEEDVTEFLRSNEIMLWLAKDCVLHQVVCKIYYMRHQLKRPPKKLLIWMQISDNAMGKILAFMRKSNYGGVSTRPKWVATDQLFTEKGVAAVGVGVVSTENLTKNVKFSR